jgi:hypothetical protein
MYTFLPLSTCFTVFAITYPGSLREQSSWWLYNVVHVLPSLEPCNSQLRKADLKQIMFHGHFCEHSNLHVSGDEVGYEGIAPQTWIKTQFCGQHAISLTGVNLLNPGISCGISILQVILQGIQIALGLSANVTLRQINLKNRGYKSNIFQILSKILHFEKKDQHKVLCQINIGLVS